VPESTAYGPWEVWGAYAVEKLGCELALRMRRADAGSTIALRFPVILGPANYVAREEFVFNRLLDRGEILVPGDGRAVVQYVSIKQVGDAVARAVDAAPAGWLPVNIGNPSFTSLTGFVELCSAIVGVEPDIRTTPAPGRPFDPYDAIFPFPNENYVLDTSVSQALGLAPAPVTLPTMLRAAFDDLIAHPERRAWQRTSAEQAVMALR
jgi:nucleoside-diphosphate-sugar epimerase